MGEWRYSSTILVLGTRWRWVVSFTTPWEKALGTHWIGGWVGPGAGLDAVEWRQISCPCRQSNPQPVCRHYTDWAIPSPECKKSMPVWRTYSVNALFVTLNTLLHWTVYIRISLFSSFEVWKVRSHDLCDFIGAYGRSYENGQSSHVRPRGSTALGVTHSGTTRPVDNCTQASRAVLPRSFRRRQQGNGVMGDVYLGLLVFFLAVGWDRVPRYRGPWVHCTGHGWIDDNGALAKW
jgi:hypothetical protein